MLYRFSQNHHRIACLQNVSILFVCSTVSICLFAFFIRRAHTAFISKFETLSEHIGRSLILSHKTFNCQKIKHQVMAKCLRISFVCLHWIRVCVFFSRVFRSTIILEHPFHFRGFKTFYNTTCRIAIAVNRSH